MLINGLEMISSNTFSDIIIVDAGSVISTNSNTMLSGQISMVT